MQDALARALDAAHDLTRRVEKDALRALVPHAKQDVFWKAQTREVYYGGANRTGKTKALMAMVASYARWGCLDPRDRGKAPVGQPKHIWVISLTNAMSRKLAQPLLWRNGEDPTCEPFIPDEEIAEYRDKPEPTLYGKDGWVITFKSCDQGALKFQGAEIDLAAFDEAPPYPIYKETAVRFGATRKCLIRMAATLLPPPGVTGGVVQWLYSEKIEPWLRGQHRDRVTVISAGMRDNPHLPVDAILEAERIYPPGSLDRRIRIDGEWLPGVIGSRCYGTFSRHLHLNPHIGPDKVDPFKPLLFALDSNVEPLCAVVVQQLGPLYRVFDEIIIERSGTMGKLAQALVQRYPGHRNELWIYGDATAQKRTAQTAKTDYELFCAGLGDWPYRLCLPTRNPSERDRINVVNFLLGADGAHVRVEVASHCTWLTADFEQVLWNRDNSGIRKAHDSQDPYYQRTHISDALGYLLTMREPHCLPGVATGGNRRRSVAIPQPHYGFAG